MIIIIARSGCGSRVPECQSARARATCTSSLPVPGVHHPPPHPPGWPA